MVESVGKKLNQARLKRGLTIDEAAHATKLRPDKITALESDDYSSFANNIYARGFLQIYARFLNVDVTEVSRTLDNANPISVSDYQYLSNAPAARRETTQIQREERKPPSAAPLFFFVIVIILGLLGSWIYTNYQRIIGERAAKSTPGIEAPDLAPAATTPLPTNSTDPTAPATPAPQAVPPPAFAPVKAAPPGAPIPNASVQLATATPGPITAPPVIKLEPAKTNDQDFVTPTPVAIADPSAHPVPASGVNEVLVATVKKTWVIVRKDDPKAPPIFEDYVYPSANPLKLKGARFFIEARDPEVVQITKNGLPYAYQTAGGAVE